MALGGVHVTTHVIWHARAVPLGAPAIKTTCQAHVLVGGRLGYSREGGGGQTRGEEEQVNVEGRVDRGTRMRAAVGNEGKLHATRHPPPPPHLSRQEFQMFPRLLLK